MSRTAASRDRTRRTAIVAASLAGHALVLLALGLTAPALRQVRMVDPEPLRVELWTLPTAERPLQRRPTPPRPSPVEPRQAARDAPPSPIAPLPMAPAQARSTGPSTGSGPGVGDHPAPLPGEARDGVRQALRRSTVGCANQDAVGLTRREREACADAYGKRAPQRADIAAPIEPDKRAAWDVAAARKEAARRRKGDPIPPGLDPSSNAGGTRTNGIGILGY
ncbi:MAG: hypothetical protein Q8L23_14765 [Caulobacter sp.]|nr:hypothetical protein [Caulobacter sp.]